ncbi:MAG: D-sedoheptulose 7-phosphate isomerase [Candidatus Omnitrophota bacterium]
MKDLIRRRFAESIEVKQKTLQENLNNIALAADEIIRSFKRGGKLILFGNGGSAADSQHIAAEFIGRFQKERKSLPAIALTTDTSVLTSLANDYHFDLVFARQIEGLGKRNDVVIAISTSGNSKNVIAAVKQAKKMGIKTISLTGCGGGKLASLTDISIIASSSVTARIQESHICIAHVICEIVENHFSKK